MRVEIRDDSVSIDGYVNAVERESKVLRDRQGGSFVERIKAGAFSRALSRAKRRSYDVKVLLNHDHSRELTSTHEATTKIYEDTIGLRCQCEIRDAEVVELAKAGNLAGWSFGFISLRDQNIGETETKIPIREVRDLDLEEVSILDKTRIPAYNGTSIEVRDTDLDDCIEYRALDDDVEVVDSTTKSGDEPKFDNHEYENRYLAALI